jgi:hypothetical protein
MSPLARIRQVAACSTLILFAAPGLAADPPAQAAQAPQAASAVQAPKATQAPQAAPAVQAPQATQAPQAAPAPQAAQPVKAPQPAQPVQLAPDQSAQIAHSALLSVAATPTADSLRLSIRRVGDKSLISSDDVTVTVDGRNESVTRENGGGYEVPINDLRGAGARDVEIIVAHDGIREILTGKVTLIEAASTDSLWRDHKQVAWWILNIVIVLVAALALSRRKG